ncbi:MAG: ABC transporter ATP-binding protein [Acidimicrobiia bacterium]
MTVLALRKLSAGYEGIPVVRDLDLEVSAGEVVALLGANGAGKTTTLLTVSGILPRIGGELDVFGAAVPMPRRIRLPGAPSATGVWRRARSGVAYVPEDRSLFFDLTVAENLRVARRRRDQPAVDDALDHFPALRPLLARRAGLLSGGEQQMLALARALVSRPRLLLVDELSLGLAPIVVERLLPVVREIATERGIGVLLVEQHVPMALAVADRAVVLQRGRITVSGTAADLADRPELLEASYLGESSV